MASYLEKALSMKDKLTEYRRHIHQNPELGMELPETTAYVRQVLKDAGIESKEICKSGIVVILGGKKPGKTILLRADMDALPMAEESGLPFASKNKNVAHTCGHDIHTTMMLGACMLLKEVENEINGTVKVMFQPGEETLEGAKAMIEAGVLKNPDVDCALDMHVHSVTPLGNLNYSKGAYTASCDNFSIVVKGRGGHGSQPHRSIDPINIACKIVDSLQSLQARETNAAEHVAMSICSVAGGTAFNIIPNEVTLKGTMRAYSEDMRSFYIKRIKEISEGVAATFGGQADFEVVDGVPSVMNNPELVDKVEGYMSDFGMEFKRNPSLRLPASEDFGLIAAEVPSVMFSIGCKPEGVENNFVHNSKVLFDEGVLPIGAAIFSHLSMKWLDENK